MGAETMNDGTRVSKCLRRFGDLTALDLTLIARLHDRELDRGFIATVRAGRFPRCLALKLGSEEGRAALALLEAAVERLDGDDRDQRDELAADYAAVYLNHTYGASPCESVWLDEDGLAMQQPMFEVRACYARHGLAAPDWRKRSDDHLVLELQFVAELLARADTGSLAEATDFLDEHLLRWVPEFAGRVATRTATQFYAGLALLTWAYLEELRDILARLLDRPRPSPEAVQERASASEPSPVAFVPGSAPTW